MYENALVAGRLYSTPRPPRLISEKGPRFWGPEVRQEKGGEDKGLGEWEGQGEKGVQRERET